MRPEMNIISRRTFLQAVSLAGLHAEARDYWNDWPNYIAAAVMEARQRRRSALANIVDEARMRARGAAIRATVWELIGGPLEKTPLNARVIGQLNRQSYRIEKIIFESQPQCYVTAHLYMPNLSECPFPGILASQGHHSNGKLYRNYQYVYQTLARNGFVVLAFDPVGQGERVQYLDQETGRSRYGPTGEHDQAGRPMLLLGSTVTQFRVWDAVRALDYLVSRPEVDPQRIGCTGHSGGGTVTMYLCALEPRIQVAVEVQGNSENFAGPQFEPPGPFGDAEQNLVGSLVAGIDRGDLLWAFAPKPLLICYTPLDAGTSYSAAYVEGTQEIYQELRGAYKLAGAPEKLDLFASGLPHDFDYFTRQAACSWFRRWLGREDVRVVQETAFETAPEAALNCTSTGQVLTSLGGRSVVQVNIDHMRSVYKPISVERIPGRLRALLSIPKANKTIEARVIFRSVRGSLVIEEVVLESEPGIRIPGWFVAPAASGSFPTVLYVSENGKDEVMEEGDLLEAVTRRGFALFTVDLRGLGIARPRLPSAAPLFYAGEFDEAYAWANLMLGKPALGQRVWDLSRCLDYLETRKDVNLARIHVLGVAGGGVVTLMALALDARAHSILIERSLADFRSVVESENYSSKTEWFVFSILREFDLPQIVATLAPRTCWFLNAAAATGKTLSESAVWERYLPAVEAYAKGRGAGKLKFMVRPGSDRNQTVLTWLDEL